MIIFENGSYMVNPLYPTGIFEDDAKYYINDNSELADEYAKMYKSGIIPVITEVSDDNEIISFTTNTSTENRNDIMAHIVELKNQLADSDYKVIKCYEASISGTEMPYDIEKLIADRNAIRDEINSYENRL